MPTFTYHGQEVTIDYLYSYARVSSPQQLIENGGEGIGRQIELAEAFAREFGVPLDPLADLGKSGSKGKQAALTEFRDLALAKKLQGQRPGLIVESFSRLSRLPIDLAMELFLAIIGEGGVTLITLVDHRVYTRQSIRRDHGQIYMVTSAMQAARSQAEATGHYSLQAWQRYRRGGASNVIPSWIMKTANGEEVASVKGLKATGCHLALALDPAKHPIILRICHMALTMGAAQIAATLNAEGVPTLNCRKRQRSSDIWDKGSVLKMLRGRQLIGQQEVARYIEGKRVVTPGVFTDAYPAAIDEAFWQRIQAALDCRQSGGLRRGRNVTRMANMFGDLARCGQCGERMKLHRRGPNGEYAYLCCSAAYVGACTNKRFTRLDKIERAILPRIADEVIDPSPADDAAEVLAKQVAKAKTEVTALDVAYERAIKRSGELAERTVAKLEREHAEKTAEVAKLERQLAGLLAAAPADELQRTVQTALDRALAGEVTARGVIADALPGLVRTIRCHPDGGVQVEIASRMVPISWSVLLT